MSDRKEDNIVWIDLELTDSNLNILDDGISYVIKHDKKTLDNMNDLNKATFSLSEVENLALDYLKKQCVFKKNPIAGNSVYMDRMFIIKYMPNLHNFLHYRIIDVSSIKELVHRWYGKIFEKKLCNHRSRSDIIESIAELKWYKNQYFTPF